MALILYTRPRHKDISTLQVLFFFFTSVLPAGHKEVRTHEGTFLRILSLHPLESWLCCENMCHVTWPIIFTQHAAFPFINMHFLRRVVLGFQKSPVPVASDLFSWSRSAHRCWVSDKRLIFQEDCFVHRVPSLTLKTLP